MNTHTGTGRKIRGDSKLEQLSAEQQASVHYWLAEKNYTYIKVVELIQTQFGVSVGCSAVGVYYHRRVLTEQHEDDIHSAAALAALPIAEFDAATVNHAKALAFNAIANPFPQIEAAACLLAIVHRVEKQQIARERLALEKRRVALREALAAHPPRRHRASQPRSTLDELRILARSLPPRSASTPPQLPQTQAPLRQTPPAAQPPPPAAPESSFPTPAPSALSTFHPPLQSPNPPDPRPHPLDPSPTDSSSSSVQSVPKKFPQNPPLLPGYSDLYQPVTLPQPTPPRAMLPEPALTEPDDSSLHRLDEPACFSPHSSAG